MADVTVEELAATVKTPVDRLLKQMADAGLPHTNGQESVSEQQKHDLLAHLRSSHGAGATLKPRGTISLKRRSVGTVKAVSQGRTGHKVKVEVMRRRTYVKPDEAGSEAPPPRRFAGPRRPSLRRSASASRSRSARRRRRRLAAPRSARRRRPSVQRKAEEQRAREEAAKAAQKQRRVGGCGPARKQSARKSQRPKPRPRRRPPRRRASGSRARIGTEPIGTASAKVGLGAGSCR